MIQTQQNAILDNQNAEIVAASILLRKLTQIVTNEFDDTTVKSCPKPYFIANVSSIYYPYPDNAMATQPPRRQGPAMPTLVLRI